MHQGKQRNQGQLARGSASASARDVTVSTAGMPRFWNDLLYRRVFTLLDTRVFTPIDTPSRNEHFAHPFKRHPVRVVTSNLHGCTDVVTVEMVVEET